MKLLAGVHLLAFIAGVMLATNNDVPTCPVTPLKAVTLLALSVYIAAGIMLAAEAILNRD